MSSSRKQKNKKRIDRVDQLLTPASPTTATPVSPTTPTPTSPTTPAPTSPSTIVTPSNQSQLPHAASQLGQHVVRFIGAVVGQAIVLLIVMPASFAIGAEKGVAFGMMWAVPCYTFFIFAKNLVKGIVMGSVGGVAISAASYCYDTYPHGKELGVAIGILIGVVELGLVLGAFPLWRPNDFKLTIVHILATTIFVLLFSLVGGFGIYLCMVIGSPENQELGLWAALVTSGCSLVSIPLGQLIRLGIQELIELAPYVRILGRALLGFMSGYLFIALIFAIWYWGAWANSPELAFTGLPKPPVEADSTSSFRDFPRHVQFGNMFYFSMVTISTLGYGEITPKSGLTKTLAMGEVLLGLGWMTVVFALVLARYQEELLLIAKKGKKTT